MTILFVFIILVLCLIIVNLYRQTIQLELHIQSYADLESEVEKFYSVILGITYKSLSELNRIDKLGAFSADDEVGFIFKSMKSIVENTADQLKNLKRDGEGEKSTD